MNGAIIPRLAEEISAKYQKKQLVYDEVILRKNRVQSRLDPHLTKTCSGGGVGGSARTSNAQMRPCARDLRAPPSGLPYC